VRIIHWILKYIFYDKLRYIYLIDFFKYNSFLKLSNLIYNNYERRIKKVTLSSKPYLINSEPTSFCNLKCLFCPTGKGYNRSGGFASTELYEKTFRRIGRYVYLLTIHGWGEPLMHKNLPEIISLAHENRIGTVVTTNGSLLTKELSREIIFSKLDYLLLSVDGASNESYQKYRIGGSFDAVVNNLKFLISLKKGSNRLTPFIEWQFIVFKHNEHELPVAKKLAEDIGVDNIVFMQAFTEDLNYDSSDEKYHLPKLSPLTKRSDCKHLWSTLTFHWNGNVVPCCYDYFGEIAYGDLLNEDFGQIWNNEYFQKSRSIIKEETKNIINNLFCSTCVDNISN
jgi:MoaA/NifB/PqqE/SkfB family radical SAM enzyme